MVDDITNDDPRKNPEVREILRMPHDPETAPRYRDWLTSDAATGRVFWRYDNADDVDRLILIIGFTDPATAFAFKMRFA